MKLFCMCLHVYLRNSLLSLTLCDYWTKSDRKLDNTMCSLCKTGVKHKAQDLTIWKKKIIGVF